MVLLIDLDDGDAREIDEAELKERGLPVGYVIASEVTTDQWIDALKHAYAKLDAMRED